MKLPHPFSFLPGNPITAIRPPDDEKVRARPVVKRSNARPTGKYFSWKMQRMVQWESINELHAFRLLDADPTVTSFGEQPMTIEYRIGDVETFHVPDILIRTKFGWELWEIKPQSEAKKDDVLSRTKLMAEALPAHGYHYRMIMGEDLASEPRFSTIQTLLKFGRDEIPEVEREVLRRKLAAMTSLTWGEVKANVLGPQSRERACRLLLEGILGWDSNLPLLHATALTLPRDMIGHPAKVEV